MTKAFIFPGQGVQKCRMGENIFTQYKHARDVADEVSHAVGYNVMDIINGDSDEILTLSYNAQISIFTVSMAIWNVITQHSPHVSHNAYYLGHSLGEYSALCASGYISITDCAKIINKRGHLMQESCGKNDCSMYAILNMSPQNVLSITSKYDDEKRVCCIANDNSSTQIVISGHNEVVEQAAQEIKSHGARAIKLNTAGAFHTRLMSEPANEFASYIRQFKFTNPDKSSCIKVINNLNADVLSDAHNLYEILPLHVKSQVRWRESTNIIANECDTIIEIGPGNVQTNMLKREYPEARIVNIDSPEAIESFLNNNK